MTISQQQPAPSDPTGRAWTCPTCGRKFQRTGQTHICSTTTVEDHLQDHAPEVVALFHAFAQMVQAAGPAEYAPVKGQVGFRGQKRIFAGVKLTRRGLEGYLDLPRRVESPRFRHVSPYTHHLFVHHFVLTSTEQLDAEFSAWVREAYLVGEGITTS